MKKQFLIPVIACSVISVCASLIFKNHQEMGFADTQSFEIVMNSSKNKFHSYTGNTAYNGDAVIKTELGNDIGFSYYQMKGVNSTWHVLGSDGYFYNTDPIHGLESITLTFKTNNAQYKIYYSADNSFNQYVTLTSSTSSSTTFNFNNYYPNYFKIENLSGSNFNISSVNLSLSCLNYYPTLNISSSDETMGSVSGSSGVIFSGTSCTVTATPNLGYKFIGWYNGSTLMSSDSSYTFNIGNDDISLVAHFTYASYNLVVESESETKGTVSNSSGTYDYLSTIEISASANTGYTFAGWYNGMTLISTDNPYTFKMPYKDTTYTAKFSTNSYELLLINNNSDLGSVSGEGTYSYGSSVTVTATPNTGVAFVGWYDSTNTLITSEKSYTFSMPYNALELTAKFEYVNYSISLSVNDSTMGSVTGDGSYIYNQEVSLVATPNSGYSFFGWYNNNELLSQDSTYTFNMPLSNLEYTAKFVKNYKLYIYSDDDTKGTVSAPSECGAGLEVTITANAVVGYALDYWYDDDLNEASYDPSYTFTMPNHDVTLHATFTTGYTLTLTSSNDSKGTVSGGGQYKAGRNVTATMTYISGIFKGWYDCDNNLVSSNNPYTFVMPSSDYFLVATFMTAEEEMRRLGIIPTLSEDEKTITYGLYPQTNVNDSTLISSLNSLTTAESNGWYLYEGEYYAKLSANPYNSSYTFDNGSTIVKGTTYWFKCEPITWNILSNDNGEYYIVSSVLLDAHRYNEYYTGTKDGHYANNYQYSEIRTWLNNDFYNSAFALGNAYIQTMTVDNSAVTTDSSSNKYACNNTHDKVYLPSYQDYKNSSYGFSTSTGSTKTRYCKTTDWARARGAYYDTDSSYLYNGYYWTRSPDSDYSRSAWYVYSDGDLFSYDVNFTGISVRPSLSIKIA